MKIAHVVSTYSDQYPDRIKRAMDSWTYDSEFVKRHVHDSVLVRDSKSVLGDSRRLPFVKDLIDYGFIDKTISHVCLTNIDSQLVSDFKEYLFGCVEGCWYSHRRDVLKPLRKPLTAEKLKIYGQESSGVDLVIMDRGWWNLYRLAYPDMLLGCEGWDWIFKFMSRQRIPMDLVGHEYHYQPKWKSERLISVSNVHNRTLSAKWFLSLEHKAEILATWPELKLMSPEIKALSEKEYYKKAVFQKATLAEPDC